MDCKVLILTLFHCKSDLSENERTRVWYTRNHFGPKKLTSQSERFTFQKRVGLKPISYQCDGSSFLSSLIALATYSICHMTSSAISAVAVLIE